MNAKKIIKIIGTVITIAALAFVVKKLFSMDISAEQFRSPEVIAAFAVCFVIQTVIIVFSCIPWLIFSESLSGKKIPFSAAMPVYTRSNLYKYVPGNVFQYIGRNQLAADTGISHVDVACATVLDIFFCVFWTGVMSFIALRRSIGTLLSEYGGRLFITALCCIGAALVIGILLFLKFRQKIADYLSRYKKAFEKDRLPRLIKGILYYLLQNAVTAVMYFICLKFMMADGTEFGELVIFTGTFLFSWIIGFITIGAPGGIGVREGVMIYMCGSDDRIILFVLVIRIASIFADVAAFLIGTLYASAYKKRTGNV